MSVLVRVGRFLIPWRNGIRRAKLTISFVVPVLSIAVVEPLELGVVCGFLASAILATLLHGLDLLRMRALYGPGAD